jgi:RNA polymerase sigma factor (sigma-70 family)
MNPKLAAASPNNQECDEIIWNAFRNNNKEAFAVIYYRFFTVLLQKGLQISSDRELVKDCIHDLFVEIWKNKMNLATPVSVRAYLIASIQRKIFRQLKKYRSLKTEIQKFPMELVHSQEDQLISEQLMQDKKFLVNRAVDSLTKRQKEAIRLKFYANLSYDEIATMMKISTDSIYNLISKAINTLQHGLYKKTEPIRKIYMPGVE